MTKLRWRLLAVLVLICVLVASLWPAAPEVPDPPAPTPDAAPSSLPTRTVADLPDAPEPPRGECTAKARVVSIATGDPVADQSVSIHIDTKDKRPPEITDAQGEVEWAGVACGSDIVFHIESGLNIHTEASAVVWTGDDGAPTVLELDPGRHVRGHVMSAAGGPIAGATIGFSRRVETDASGAYTVAIPSATDWYLRVRAPGHASASEQIEPGPPGKDLIIDFTLDIAHHVQVTCDDGGAMRCFGEALVLCVERGADPREPSNTHGSCRFDDTNDTGTCECPPGPATVWAPFAEVDVDDTTDAVTLEPTDLAAVQGRMLLDGAPIKASGMLMALGLAEGGGLKTFQADADGGFTVDGVAPGVWRLEIMVWNGSEMIERTFEVTVDGAATVDLGDLELGGTGKIAGRVTTDTPPLPEGLIVLASPADGQPRRTPSFTGVETDGRFTLAGLEPGPWVVWERRDAGNTRSVTVEADVISEVTLPLANGLRFVDDGFTLDIDAAAEDISVHEVDPDGPAHAAGLRAGDTFVDALATDASGQPVVGPLQLQIDTALMPGGRLTSITVERDGEPLTLSLP